MPGDRGFDPLRFTDSDWNMAEVIIPKERWMGEYGTVPMVYWMREAELKHARVAMLATVGVLFVEGCGSMPGFPEGKGQSQMDVFWDVWAEHPNYIAAALTFFTVIEVISGVATTAGRESGLRDAGDFGFNPLGFKDTMQMRTKEIANGRLAMLAAAGMIMQGMTTHNGCLANLLTGE